MTAEKLHILVLDLDACLNTIQTNNPELLSRKILDYVENNKQFTHFYVMTHRCLSTTPLVVENGKRSLARLNQFISENIPASKAGVPSEHQKLSTIAKLQPFDVVHPKSYMTHQLVENFSRKTGLICLGVSTAEDQKRQCGVGYIKIIRPYEQAVLKHSESTSEEKKASSALHETQFNWNLKLNYEITPVETFDHNTKNPQLFQIIQHVSKQFPNASMHLHYWGDRLELCKEALTILPSHIPDNITLSSYQHLAYSDNGDPANHLLVPIGTIQGTWSAKVPRFPTHSNPDTQSDPLFGEEISLSSPLLSSQEEDSESLSKAKETVRFSLANIITLLEKRTQSSCCPFFNQDNTNNRVLKILRKKSVDFYLMGENSSRPELEAHIQEVDRLLAKIKTGFFSKNLGALFKEETQSVRNNPRIPSNQVSGLKARKQSLLPS